MTYYKCVTSDLKSSNANYPSIKEINLLVIQYKIGEFVKPLIKGTRLFVFDSLDNVKLFVGDQIESENRKIRIFECEVKNPKSNPKLYRFFSDAINVLKKKKSKKKIPKIYEYNYSMYRNISIGCSEVKLTTEIFFE